MTAPGPQAVFLCTNLTNDCCCCGGSLGPHPVPSARGKALRYCSVECHDAWEEHLDEQNKQRSEQWCPTCGYDRHEHAPTCADHLAHLREQTDRPELYGTPT